MTHIIKIIKDGEMWHLEDWKQRWVQRCKSEDVSDGTGTEYGNVFPYSLVWHFEDAIRKGMVNYFHATWNGTYWEIHGRCCNPKRTW